MTRDTLVLRDKTGFQERLALPDQRDHLELLEMMEQMYAVILVAYTLP